MTWIGLPILVLCLGHVFSNAVRTLPAIAVDVLTRDLGLSAETLAQVTGLFPLAFAAAMVPVGVALDRHGVRRVALALLAIGLAGAVLATLATGAWGMVAAQVVLGLGCSGMLMCPITYAARALPAARFAVWSGVIQAFGNTGMLISASPLAALVEAAGWRAGYAACAAIAALAIPAVLLLVPRDVPEARADRSAFGDARDLLRIAWLPQMRGLMVFAFASFAAVLGVRGLWGGPWLMEVKGLDRIAAGHALLACTVALTLGPIIAGLVLRRVGRPVALLAGSHIVAAGVVLAMVAAEPLGLPVAVDGALLVGFGLIISFQVLAFAIVREAVPPAEAGRALSAANFSFFFGAALLQGVSGLAAGWGGVGAAMTTFAGALVVCSLGLLALAPRRVTLRG